VTASLVGALVLALAQAQPAAAAGAAANPGAGSAPRAVARAAPASPASAPATHITVLAAASLADAFHDIAARLRAARPGLEVRFDFAGSQQLALAIEQGAMADVFASADTRWMDYVTTRGLAAGEPRLFAGNRLVVIVPRANPARIGRLQALARPGVKLVLAAEAVPVGAYSREALAKLAGAPGFPADYARKVLANVVSQEDNVRGVVGKVQLGEADAGLVYESDVASAAAGAVRMLEIPGPYNVLARYPIVVLRSGRRAAEARAFVDFVCSRSGQEVLGARGFLPAGSAAR